MSTKVESTTSLSPGNSSISAGNDLSFKKSALLERLQKIVDECRLMFDCHFCSITYLSEDKKLVEQHVVAHTPSYKAFDALTISEAYIDEFKKNFDAVLVNKHGDQTWLNKVNVKSDSRNHIPAHTGFIVPMVTDSGILLGLLQLVDKIDNSDFNEGEKLNVKRVIQLFIGVFELEKKVSDLHHLNRTLREESTKLNEQASFDDLTRLLNRGSLEEKLTQLINKAKLNHQEIAVALLDLDHFKEINDTLGHKAGDCLLKTVAERIQKCARQEDIVARLGGDEFVIVIDNPTSHTIALDILQRILSELSKPIKLAHRELEVSCSIGYSFYPRHGSNPETLLQHADSAMYQVKRNEKGNLKYFSAEVQSQIEARILLEKDLHIALKRDEFELHYQPQMDMRTGSIVGLEALIRWKHAKKGYIPPDDFISIAEEIGLIVPIGDWVFRSACQQIASWQRKRIKTALVSINFSVKQLVQPDLVSHLSRILQEEKVTAKQITIEITEGLFLDDVEKHIGILESLKELGFRISIDDFGTGYSNLNYLKRFPIDEIKIDRSFVNDITTNPYDKAIATTIIAIAHNLGFKVVSEGIEKKSQLALLAKNQCDILQGYYFSKALPVDECEKLLVGDEHLRLDGIRPKDYQRAILLVDDEPNILKSLKRALRHLEAKVYTTNNAEEALEALALNEVGVILSDLNMPKVDGIELLDKVHQMHPYTVRMILSGNEEFENACDAINRSAIHKYITKPWSDEHLLKEIEEGFLRYESQFY